MKTLTEIKDHLGQQKRKLAAQYAVKELGIFGSYVRGEQQPNSDLDILIDFDEYPSLLEFMALEQALSEQLGLPVDLVMKSDLKPRLRQRILQEVVYL
jgi:predicted nucleotidyltransferase